MKCDIYHYQDKAVKSSHINLSSNARAIEAMVLYVLHLQEGSSISLGDSIEQSLVQTNVSEK